MLKKLTVIILLLVFAKPAYDFFIDILLSSENPSLKETVMQEQNNPLTNTKAAELEVNRDVEVTLPEKVTNAEQLTDAFAYYFSQFSESFEITYVGNTKKIDELIAEASKKASERNPYIYGHMRERNIEYSYNRLGAKLKVTQTYHMTKQQALFVDEAINKIIRANEATLTTDYKKVKFVNDYIVQNVRYNLNTTNSPHSAYTAFIEGEAVCQGYALLAQSMLTKLGLQSLYVTGIAGNEDHAWNLVMVDGKWFHLDTTWNDPLPDRGKKVSTKYFLKSDQALSFDHQWEMDKYPAAVSEDYAYLQ